MTYENDSYITYAQSDLIATRIAILLIRVSLTYQWISGALTSDCVNAQANLVLSLSHMADVSFSHAD